MFDVEQMKDPWGGTSKKYIVEDHITGQVLGATNSEVSALLIAAEYPRGVVRNDWSKRIANNLFGET